MSVETKREELVRSARSLGENLFAAGVRRAGAGLECHDGGSGAILAGDGVGVFGHLGGGTDAAVGGDAAPAESNPASPPRAASPTPASDRTGPSAKARQIERDK